jgi:transposase
MHVNLIDQHTHAIDELAERIEVVIEPFRGFRELICSIPGISTRTADVIIAETGADMNRFSTAGHLASWAGVCPGHHESAGRVKSSHTRSGNPHLKAGLGTAAMNAAKTGDGYLGARHRRIAARRSKAKAIVAVQHTILTIIWNMAHTGALYNDLGADYYRPLRPDRVKRTAVRQLEALGYTVTLQRAG